MADALDAETANVSEAVEDLHRRHGGWLTSILGHRYGPEEAEDIAQETWLRLVPIAQERGVEHPKALLLTIAANLARDLSAKRNVRRAHVLSRAGPWHHEASQLTGVMAQELLASLPEPLRDVFVLSRIVGLTNVQIGEKLGIAPKTVEWRMTKALAHCAAQLRR